MRKRNFKLAQAIFESGLPQFQIAQIAGLSSEARLSRLVGLRVKPSREEIKNLAMVLSKSPEELGLTDCEGEVL